MPSAATYKCPRCGAPLAFSSETQSWSCAFCLGDFSLEELEAMDIPGEKEADAASPEPEADGADPAQQKLLEYRCPSCGAQVITEADTAATFCAFCQSPAILTERLSGEFRPAKLIPFRLSREDAKAALKALCRRKPLLPGDFVRENHIEKLTGVYAPYWLFDCSLSAGETGEGTRVTCWSDSTYRYTKTDYYRVVREGNLRFEKVPADGSSRLDDQLMDALEPYDYGELREFSMPYLSGYQAQRYDRNADAVFPRVLERMQNYSHQLLEETISGYATYRETGRRADADHVSSSYTLLPVWLLSTRYKGEEYLFAMNGQTGKTAGKLPVSPLRAFLWGAGTALAAAALALIGGILLWWF